jgi:Protein of unknown function (DUF1615)
MKRLFIILLAAFIAGPALAADLGIVETTKLIQKTRKSVVDAQGWAIDLLDVMHAQNQPASRENICAAIAIIDQESNFVADPAVAGLGSLAEKSLRAKADHVPILGRLALQFLETTPSPQNSYLARIRSAKTERDLDMTYRAMVDDASNRANFSVVMQTGLLNQMIEDRNDINTIGSMQVSVRFALNNAEKKRWLPMSLADVYALRDELYTRRGGMYYGVLQLLGYDSGYNRKIFRFADYNAGRYASRNAALQIMIAELSQTVLASDGDLLLYAKNQTALKKASASELALRQLHLGIDDKKLRADLMHEKDQTFPATQTYLLMRDLYNQRFKKSAEFAVIPNIELTSIKIRHHMTTKDFAQSVDRRYQKCVGR